MPKPTFFRLPEEKRMRLVKAAYSEFTRAPFADASISNIIKDAGIPRGSFYQYFEDKSDIFFYLLDRMRDNAQDWMQRILTEQKGDFFTTAAILFDKAIDSLVDGPYAPFYRNVFMYMDFHSAAKLTPAVHPPKGKGQLVDLLVANIDRSQLDVQSDDEVRMLVHLVLGLFMQTMGYYYNHLADGEETSVLALKKRMAQLLQWLKYGAIKKEEAHD